MNAGFVMAVQGSPGGERVNVQSMDEGKNDRAGSSTPQQRAELLRRVENMSREEIDALPVGVITLDLDGTIVRYNREESLMSRRDADAQIGKNFFADVAPCTAEAEFEGRFRELAGPRGHGTEDFSYIFRFPWGTRRVLITFMRSPGAPCVQTLVTWLSSTWSV
jgi:photoactive yellow protein